VQRFHDEMPTGSRRVAGVRTTMVLLIAFASVPATLTDPKQPINRILLLRGRLGVRKP
jgi:hypothetical protein